MRALVPAPHYPIDYITYTYSRHSLTYNDFIHNYSHNNLLSILVAFLPTHIHVLLFRAQVSLIFLSLAHSLTHSLTRSFCLLILCKAFQFCIYTFATNFSHPVKSTRTFFLAIKNDKLQLACSDSASYQHE